MKQPTKNNEITMQKMKAPLLISVQTVAAMLSMSTRQVWRLRDAGDMPPPIKLGKIVRWRANEIAAWVQDGCPSMQQERRRAS